ncbi:MAG: UbiA family prenyltransferase [Candidatus Micrarchaeaceae archaeon]
MIKEYLQLGRAQTASVEIGGFTIAGILSHTPLWLIIIYAFMGLLTHLAGFGENSISDLKYDKSDPNKQKHPLVSGKISLTQGWRFVLFLQTIVILFVSIIVVYRGTYLSLIPFLIFIIFGYIYNHYAKIHKVLGVFSISLSFASIFLTMAMLWNGSISLLIWSVTIYSFLYVMLQIAILGEIKDIEQSKENNILRRLGLKISFINDKKYYIPSKLVIIFVVGLFFIRWYSLFVISLFTMFSYLIIFLIFNVATLIIYSYSLRHYSSIHIWNRNKELRNMGLLEAFTYVLLVIALSPVLGILATLLLIFIPMLWFIFMNKFLWPETGSSFAPGV